MNLSRIIDEALTWERRSGATFEEGKTAYIYFTRNSRLLDTNSIKHKRHSQSSSAGSQDIRNPHGLRSPLQESQNDDRHNDRGHRYNCKIPCIRWTSPGGLYCYRHGLYTLNEWRIQRGKNTANSACKRPGRVVGHSFVFS